MILIVATVKYYEWMPSLIFISYLIYGFVRPFISRQWRREFEEDEEDEGGEQSPQSPTGNP